MKLFASMTSPYARKVRMVALEKRLPMDVIDVQAADPRVAERNPMAKVPVLERDDGSTLFDSVVIVQYLDSLAAPALIPIAGEARWRALRWEALGDGIMDAVITRLLEKRRPAEQQSADALKHQEGKVARCLEFAEREIGEVPWLVENRITIADIALATALSYVDLRYPHDWRRDYPRLTQWLATFSARSSFVETESPR